MRTRRIIESGPAYYHVMSRVVDRRYVLDHDEKERFRRLLRDVAAFSGIDVLTYACMDNHFHALVFVPAPVAITEVEALKRMKHLYAKTGVRAVELRLRQLRQDGEHEQAEALLDRYTQRMHDLSAFMKTFKQRLTQSYNRRHERKGTLWEERFKSVLVEGDAEALSTMAAYIDLNAVRAGIVGDPKDYRFCGYGEACGGSDFARQGLAHVVGASGGASGWRQVQARYRQLLYVSGEARGLTEDGRPLKHGLPPERIEQVLRAGGQLPRSVLLRCRVRYLSDGAIFGHRRFVDAAVKRHRHLFGKKRQTGARHMCGGGWGELATARRLRLTPITC